MSTTTLIPSPPLEAKKIQVYYQFHAKIYDMTRWLFLFGRHRLLDLLPFSASDNPNIVEVGCGTGHNLLHLAHTYPNANIVGIDISADMLDEADRKLINTPQYIQLKQGVYGEKKFQLNRKAHCVLFSYCLTMVNPNWDKLIAQAKNDLSPEGYIAVVDFHRSSFKWFRKWMSYNHVRMEGHILPYLTQQFETVQLEKRSTYFGLWHYFLFIGKTKQ
ncbi:MAG: class I SAM-dependent methyltransferase [Saprospiraceae bacterium]|nr:class I SAM-dependent methyltransferase [Saprospiraceae bacterium]